MSPQPIDTDLLQEGVVQVWRIELPGEPLSEEGFLRTLSPEEMNRAGRLRPGQVRMQFVVGRSLLRSLLGREMGVPAAEVRLIAGEYGKPEMVPLEGKAVAFNIAHSRSTVLVALCDSGTVGVDLEYIDRQADIAEVARHAMSARERDELLSLSDPGSQRRAFFRSWTRKEAIVKADGRGLSLPLTSFEIPLGGQIELSLPIMVPNMDSTKCTTYYVRDIDKFPGMYAAVASTLQPKRLQFVDLGEAGLLAWE